MKQIRLAVLTIGSIGMSWLAVSCTTTRLSAESDITISSPHVDTRARLLEERQEDVEWLTALKTNSQLGNPAFTTRIEGAVARSTFRGVGVDVGATYDRGEAVVSQKEARNEAQRLDQSQAIGAQQSETYLRRLEQERELDGKIQEASLALVDEISNIATDDSETNKAAVIAGLKGALEALAQLRSDAATGLWTSTYSSTFGTNPIPSVDLPSLAQSLTQKIDSLSLSSAVPTSTVSISRVNELNDRLAFGDALNAAIRSRQLDDTHDAAGRVLYTLSFRVGIRPSALTSKPANVALVLTEPNRNELQDVYDRVREQLVIRLNTELDDLRLGASPIRHEELYTLAKRMPQGCPTTTVKPPAATIASTDLQGLNLVADSPNETEGRRTSRARDERTESLLKLLESLPSGSQFTVSQMGHSTPSTKESTEAAKKCDPLLSEHVIQDRYGYLTNFFNVSWPATTNAFVTFARPDKKQSADFDAAISDLWSKAPPRVYSVEPKQEAQNISRIEMFQNRFTASLSILAAIPNAGLPGVKAAIQSVHDEQTMMSTIQRNPLIVAYPERDQRFGWRFGAPFAINGKEVTFEHVENGHDVFASVVVPAWAQSINMRYGVSWGQWPTAITNDLSVTTGLIPDYETLIDALGGRYGVRRQPFIYTAPTKFANGFEPSTPTLKALDGATKILVFGRNLWRGARVFLGAVEAEDVVVLPHMEGLVAVWTSLPDTVSGRLSVHTSEGTAFYPESINVVAVKSPKETEPKPTPEKPEKPEKPKEDKPPETGNGGPKK